MGKWECYRCSYVTEGENPPEECPNCHYSVTFWIERVEEKQLTVKDFVRSNLLGAGRGQLGARCGQAHEAERRRKRAVKVNGEHVGIVTERDILYKVAAEDLPASKVPLKNVMSPTVFSARSDTPIKEALRLMAKHHIRRLVVTEDGKPIGMVSQRSIIGGSFRLAKDSGEDKERD